jgi:hypothetical protein
MPFLENFDSYTIDNVPWKYNHVDVMESETSIISLLDPSEDYTHYVDGYETFDRWKGMRNINSSWFKLMVYTYIWQF